MAYSVTDEIFALDASLNSTLKPAYHYGITSVAVPGWVLGTLAGAVSGTLLPAFVISALGVAIYGMFLAIIIPPARQECTILTVVLSAMGLSFLFCPPGTQPSLIGLCHHYHNGRGRRHRSMVKANSRGRKQRRELK